MTARVLLTDGHTPAALAAARSLAAAGHRVVAVVSSRHDPCAASAAVARTLLAPDPCRDPDGFARRVGSALAGGNFDLFLPVSDAALLLGDRLRASIPRRTVAALPDPGRLGALLDKRAVLARAAALGIPVLPARTLDDLDGAPLPAVVKPGRSRVVAFDGVRAASARVVGDPAALRGEMRRLAALGFGAYAEPWIPGEGRGIFLLLHDGRILARFAHRRVREAAPLGGPSAVAESVPADPDLLRDAERLALDLGVSGPFMAEFRCAGRDRVLLEVNARYWGSMALAVACGVDFPALHADALLGRPRPGPASWPGGVRVRHLGFDLRHALLALLGPAPGIDVPWPARGETLRAVLTERAPGMLLARGDPAPARAFLVALARKVWRHV